MDTNPAQPPTGMTTDATTGRSVVVPDRPALEGLEDKWVERWSTEGTLRVRPLEGP